MALNLLRGAVFLFGELTRNAGIQLNERVLQHYVESDSEIAPDDFPNVRAHRGKAARRLYSAWRLCFRTNLRTTSGTLDV